MRISAISAALVVALAAPAWSQVNNDGTPEANFINQQYNLGLAAGNAADWYINCDGNHENFPSGPFLQLNRYPDNSASSFQTGVRNAPRNLLGNASLGVGGLWSITRYFGMYVSAGNALNTQYRSNQHYFYPAVDDTQNGNARDLTFALYPFVTQSVGKSHSERDEVRKFFLGMAAVRPDVKTILQTEGLLIPTLQMAWRRTRVASDAEYLSGLAHPSAFANVSNELAMVQMVNGITADKIPPLVQMEILDENFFSSDPTKFNDRSTTSTGEFVFTTPLAIGRVWRGPEYTKRMVVSVENSFDVNDHALSFDFVVLRGDPGKVRITPLNPEGTLVEIEMDYFATFTEPHTGELSNMLVIGVFAHNGYYYSSPAFITCSTLWNETRTYRPNHQLSGISYSATEIQSAVSYKRSWSRDVFTQDAYGRVFTYQRVFSASTKTYSEEGYQVVEKDADGRPSKVTPVSYSSDANGVTTVATTYTDPLDWRYQVLCDYASVAIPVDGSHVYTAADENSSFSIVKQPLHGTVTIVRADPGLPDSFTYTPDAGFSGVDRFVISESNATALESKLRKVRVVVGPADTEAPAQVQNAQVIGEEIQVARVTWDHTTENYEVEHYAIYRDGSFLGKAYGLEYLDASVVIGQGYSYTVVAVDDAGNASPLSAPATGGGATLWGQDNFNDNNIAAADATLASCLTWTKLSGAVTSSAGTTTLKLGVNQTVATVVIANQTIQPPFTLDFTNSQQYNTSSNGPVLLYQDDDNYYYYTINRDTCALYRRMDGVDTLLGSSNNLKLQHASSKARYQITVIATGGIVTFRTVRREWTVSPDLVNEEFWYDPSPAAFQRFASGPVGFRQMGLSTNNVPTYDALYLTRADGEGPDLDGDGLIDAWERAYFGDPNAASADPTLDLDGDGISTGAEQLWGTSPTGAGSAVHGATVAEAGGQLTLTWPSIRGRKYTLWYTPDMSGWSEVTGAMDLPATPPENSVMLGLPAGPVGGFRVEVEATP